MEPFTLTRAQVRDLDRRAIEEYGLPGIVLMENAGRGCAELLMRLNPEKRLAVILCGPGNNGGDGFVMARHLDNHGWPVEVWCFFAPESVIGDAGVNHRAVVQSRLPIRYAPPPPRTGHGGEEQGMTLHADRLKTCWVIDALFGTGLNRPIDHMGIKLALAFIKYSNCPVLAVDLPSGLDCDTGEPLGPTVRATHTATFVAPKRGFLNPKSREWTGQVHVIDIGAPKKLVDEYRI